MNTTDIYNDKMNYMWKPAVGIEPGSSAWMARRVTARPPRLIVQYQLGLRKHHIEKYKMQYALQVMENKNRLCDSVVRAFAVYSVVGVQVRYSAA